MIKKSNFNLIFQQHGNQLIISNAHGQDSGRYICVCYTNDGQQFESVYELNIAEQTQTQSKDLPSRVEHAEVGSSVVLHCNPSDSNSRYHWSRQHGQFAPGQDISSVCDAVPFLPNAM